MLLSGPLVSHQLSNDLSVSDRLGFALTFLSDVRLLEYLEQLKEKLNSAAHFDLQALIITG